MTKRTIIAAFLCASAIALGLKSPSGSAETAVAAVCLASTAVNTAAENLGSAAEGFGALSVKLLGEPIHTTQIHQPHV
jgi:hypothetical protein